MKKIKGLLLFGILTLLGIGSSFGTFFELNDLTGSQLLIPNYSYRLNGTKYYSTYNYTLGSVSYHSGEFQGLNNVGVLNLHVCRDSNLNILGFSNYAYYVGFGNRFTISFGDTSNCSSFNELTNFEYVYLSNSISIFPYSTRSTGNINSYIYFDDNSLYTNYGSVRDVPIGYTRQKLFLSFVGNYGIFSTDSSGDYLFTSIGRDSFNVEDSGDGLYNFDLDVYSGILELHYSDYSLPYYSGSRTIILSLGSGVIYFNFYTGYYYGIKEIQDGVLPLYKGYLTYNNSSFEGYTQFINFLNNGHKIVLSNGSSNGISFTSYGYNYFTQTNQGGGNFTTTSNLTLNFQSDDSVPTFITPSGNGNQSTGSIAINTGLLNSCLNDLTFGELNSYLCNQLLSNLGYPVQIPGTSGQYISVSIDENGNLKYRITTQEDLEQQMSGFVRVENEDGTRSTVCPSGDCLGTVLAQPILHGDTGFELTTGDVLDMMSNLTGWVGRCPFPYTDFRLGKNLKLLQLLQDYGFNYDPFIIINCSVAGFHYGRHTIDNTLFGNVFEHPLLYGDTPKHRSLFVFLDFVVILGLFGLFAFIKKIF